MSDPIGLRYLFDQPNPNSRKSIWLAMINEFDFKIRYIKGENNRVVDALSRRVNVSHVEAMISYGRNLLDWILQAGQQHDKYQQLKHRL